MTKYEIIYNDILDKIKNNDLKDGDSLQSEKELMKIYDVSRHTVRRALELLNNGGFIQKNQGRPATIINKKLLSFPISEISSFKEINELEGLNATTKVENLEILKDKKLLNELFGVNGDEEIYKVTRSRIINGEKVILDIDFFRKSIIKHLPLRACENSIYEYIENELELNIGYAIKQFYCEKPNKQDSEILDLNEFNTVAVVQSNTYLADKTIFQYTLSRHRPDRFRFVEIAKRV